MPSAPPTEPLCAHQIETFLCGPLPRKVPLSPAIGVLLACASVFWMVCAGIGILAFYGAMQLIWLDWQGRTVPARVVAVVFEDGRRGPAALEPLSEVAGVVYTYRAEDDAVHTGISLVTPVEPEIGSTWHSESSTPRMEQLRAARLEQVRRIVTPGYSWPVRSARWGRGVICEPGGHPSFGKPLFLVILGAFVGAAGTVFALRLLRWLRARAVLLRRGIATVGTILHKRTDADDVPKFYLRYGYAAGTERYDGEEQCSPHQWHLFQVGDPVTILHDADDPRRAALYRLLPFHRQERKPGPDAA